MPASTILLFETDPASSDLVAGRPDARRLHRHGRARPRRRRSPRSAEHQLVILDLGVGRQRPPSDVCREIRATPALAAVPVLCISQTDDVEERIRFLEAGADDVMAKPFDARELEARVEALLLRFQRSQDLAPVDQRGSVATLQPRAGSSPSSAPRAASARRRSRRTSPSRSAQRKPDRALLIDLHLQFGQVATHLNLDAAPDARRRSSATRRRCASRSCSGRTRPATTAASMSSPRRRRRSSRSWSRAAHVEQILDGPRPAFDAVVVDAGSGLDERVAGRLSSWPTW